MKQQEIAQDKLQKEANRANAVNKALENATALLDKNILNVINDEEEMSLKTLFDESMLSYRLTEYPKIENCVSWSLKHVKVEDGQCVAKFRDADWTIIIIEGAKYFKKLITYRDKPEHDQSIKKFICDTRRSLKTDVIIVVYNLANYLKCERARDAKNYRKNFKNRFEGGGSSNDVDQDPTVIESTSVSNIGPTDLQDLRIMLEVELKHEHPDWKIHFEFYEKTQEVVQALARYTSSIAKFEIKRRNRSTIDIDWAINMDKEKAVDPTKSTEDLTKLWITQLQQFSQITLPIARTIASEYPSPSALLDQYKNLTTSEAEDLLASLHVQKNLKRTVGPNISRRIHCFMTSRDPDVHIGYG